MNSTPSLPTLLLLPIDLNGIWHWGWFAVCGATLVLTVLVSYRTRLWFELGYLYFSLWCFWSVEHSNVLYGDYTHVFQSTAASAWIEAACVLALVSKAHRFLWKALPYFAGLEIVMVWIQHAGFLGWETFDCALVAVTIPYLPTWLALSALLTFVTHGAHTAMLIFTAMLLTSRSRKKMVTASILLFVCAWWAHRGLPFGAASRLAHWKEFFGIWKATGIATWIFGTGPGSFQWISFLTHKSGELYLQMHNDWFQILFEEGVIGLFFALMTYGGALFVTRKYSQIHSAVVGAGVFALTYHPLRFAPSALLLALLFHRAYAVSATRPPPSPSAKSDPLRGLDEVLHFQRTLRSRKREIHH